MRVWRTRSRADVTFHSIRASLVNGETSGATAFSREDELARDRASWLIRLRSGAVFLILFPLVIGAASNQLPDAGKLWILVAIVGATNALIYTQRARPWTWSGRSLLGQALLDVLALTLALHLTGGVENPFQVYYLFPVIVSGVVLPARQSYAVAALAAAGFAGVAVLEYAGVIAHHDVAILPFWSAPGAASIDTDQYKDARYIAGASGVLLSTIAFACSITTSLVERLRRGERALGVEKGKLEAVLRAMGEGVAYFDEASELAFANEAFRACLGSAPPQRLADLMPGALRDALRSALDRLHSGAAYHSFEVEDEGRSIASGVSAVRDARAGLVGLVWMIEDVTSRREARREEERRARLADLGVLAAGIAHEVMNPLSSIASTTAFLEASVADPVVQRKTKQVKTHVDRITRIVRGIADLARSPSPGVPVPLDHVLDEAIARAREERPATPRRDRDVAPSTRARDPRRRGAARPGLSQPHQERARRRGSHRSSRRARAPRGSLGRRRRRGRRPGGPGRAAREGLSPVLHDEGARRGSGAGPRDRGEHRAAPRRDDRDRRGQGRWSALRRAASGGVLRGARPA